MPPEDCKTTGQAGSPWLEVGRSLSRQEMAPEVQSHLQKKEERKVGAFQAFIFSWQHELLLSRKGEID